MAIEHTPGVGTLITGDHIDLFRLMAVASALALEINTGMKMSHGRQTVMAIAKKITGSSKRTKRGVLADLVTYTKVQFPYYTPVATVTKALEN